jgi:hypothetical protein
MDLSPEWVVGFVDGEGCFHVSLHAHPEMTAGYQVIPEFVVVQHIRDVQVLYALKRFFRCGVVRCNHEDRWAFRVRKLDGLTQICAFFEQHHLKTKKLTDFQKFRSILRLMSQKRHLAREGLVEIGEIALSMNTTNRPVLEKIVRSLRPG